MSQITSSHARGSQPLAFASQEPSRSVVHRNWAYPLYGAIGDRLALSHVADAYRRYPGESVTLLTRVQAHQAVVSYDLYITIPAGVRLKDYRGPASGGSELVETDLLIWRHNDALVPGMVHDYELFLQIESSVHEQIESRAWVTYPLAQLPEPLGNGTNAQERQPANGTATSQSAVPLPSFTDETTTITVITKGDYLQYLPTLYEQDQLMNQLLILLEGFWAPLEGQLTNIQDYFDPKLAPRDMLRWLVAWFDLPLTDWFADETQLRRAFIALITPYWVRDHYGRPRQFIPYRQRGTRQGLQKFIEILTGEPVEIIENSAHQFRLGAATRLGLGLTFGSDLHCPHNFLVRVAANARSKEQQLRALIEAEKPAHTTFTLEWVTTEEGVR